MRKFGLFVLAVLAVFLVGCGLHVSPDVLSALCAAVPTATATSTATAIPTATVTPTPTSTAEPTSTPSPVVAGCPTKAPLLWIVNGASACAGWMDNSYGGHRACGLDATWWFDVFPDSSPHVPVNDQGRTYAPDCGDPGHMESAFMQAACYGHVWKEDARGVDFTAVGECVSEIIHPWNGNAWEALVVLKDDCSAPITTTTCFPPGPVDQECGIRFDIYGGGRGCHSNTFTP